MNPASMICFAVGGVLVAAGLIALLVEAIGKARAAPKPSAGATAAEGFSIAGLIDSFVKLLKELRKHPLPFRLIFMGVLLILVGAGLTLVPPTNTGSGHPADSTSVVP